MSEQLPPEPKKNQNEESNDAPSEEGQSSGPRGHTLSATTSEGNVYLSWDRHWFSGAGLGWSKHYQVRRNNVVINSFSAGNATTFSYTDSNATLGTSHTYKIGAYWDDIGSLAFSNSVTITPQETTVTAPGTPTGLSTTVLSTSSIRLNWNQGSGDDPDIYAVNIQNVATGTYLLSPSLGTTSTNYTFTSLDSNTQYRLWVRAQNSAGNSSWTNSTATTDEDTPTTTPPGVPGSPTFSSITTNGSTMTWAAPTSGGAVATYEGQWRQGASGSFTAGFFLNTNRTHNATGGSPGTTYQWQIRARNTAGASAWSSIGQYTTLADVVNHRTRRAYFRLTDDNRPRLGEAHLVSRQRRRADLLPGSERRNMGKLD